MAGISVEVSMKDTGLFKQLCEVTAFLINKADPITREEATRQLVEAGIVEDPQRLMASEDMIDITTIEEANKGLTV